MIFQLWFVHSCTAGTVHFAMELIHMILKFSSGNGFIALFADCNISGTVNYMHLVIGSGNLATAKNILAIKIFETILR